MLIIFRESDLRKIIDYMGDKHNLLSSMEDAEILHYVCTVISIRGALLVSICKYNIVSLNIFKYTLN